MKIFQRRFQPIYGFLKLVPFIFLLLACSKGKDQPDYYVDTPIAGFSWTGNEGPAPVTVQFVNSSEYADIFEWNFDDGGTSTETNPQHTFYNNGTKPKNFNVVLKATDSGTGLYQRRSRVIVIQPAN